ncbi:RidA family protein [Lentzea fradiae]|uniref:RidA family protein n=1 Tax=Lentzea fradiae TaxID=200378 RepID=UPI000B7E23C4|nr:RidA family protein [Lentzea fradiae]
MERTTVNPWPWSVGFGFNQGEVVSGQSRTLFCAGQGATDAGGRPVHEGDMAAQVELSVANLEAVLAAAGMSLSDVVRLTVYTTDVDVLLEHYGVLTGRLRAAGVATAMTLLGVQRLAFPSMLVELEATAVA